MKIFLTGASGFIGSAVAERLAACGHEVHGLLRSPVKGRALGASELLPVAGTMQEPEAWLPAARDCQVLVHCAAEMTAEFHTLDQRTVEALLEAARTARAPRLVAYTSGVWVYGDTGECAVDESAHLRPPALTKPRVETEERVLAGNRGLVRTLVLRPGCVYGGSGSLTAAWFESAATSGAARIVGEGANRWAMVHRADLAELYRLAIESPLAGEVFNATDRSRFTVRECAMAASRAAGSGKIDPTPVAAAVKAMGPFAECLALSQHVDSSKAARLLGWQPRHAGFVDEIDRLYVAWKSARVD